MNHMKRMKRLAGTILMCLIMTAALYYTSPAAEVCVGCAPGSSTTSGTDRKPEQSAPGSGSSGSGNPGSNSSEGGKASTGAPGSGSPGSGNPGNNSPGSGSPESSSPGGSGSPGGSNPGSNGSASGNPASSGPGVQGPGGNFGLNGSAGNRKGSDFYNQCLTIYKEDDAKPRMTVITVPVWRLKNDVKTAGTMQLTVNGSIAEEVKQIFKEIYEGPQQFPISDAGGFSWRGDGSKSEHNWGTAIDLNSNSNYCLYADGTVVGDHWTPGLDPYSFYADCDVVKVFKKHGFLWGGDWPWSTRDYMHFSYFGT